MPIVPSARVHPLSDQPASGLFLRASEGRAGESGRTPTTAIQLTEAIRLGGRTIDPGLYRVRVDDARERVVLENDDRTYALTAFFRRARGPASFAMTARVAHEGGRATLVVRLASGLEWAV